MAATIIQGDVTVRQSDGSLLVGIFGDAVNYCDLCGQASSSNPCLSCAKPEPPEEAWQPADLFGEDAP